MPETEGSAQVKIKPGGIAGMVSYGSSYSNRRDRLALRGLVGAIIFMVAVGMISAALNWGSFTRSVREGTYPIPATQCQQDKSCEEKALQIDAREAITADVALDVAFVQLALSLAGIFAVGATLYYAHRAWEEARRSANAAHDALENAKADATTQSERFQQQIDAMNRQADVAAESANRQLRAYVSVEDIECVAEFGADGQEAFFAFRTRWKNFGKTPAFKVKVFANCWHWHGNKLPPWFTYPDIPTMVGPEDGFPNILFPGEVIRITPFTGLLPVALKAEVKFGCRRIFCWGWITYEDIFGIPHRVTYCRRIRVISVNEDGAPERFEPVFYDEHNCVDNEGYAEDRDRQALPIKIANALLKEREMLEMLKEQFGDYGINADQAFWHRWLISQAPETFERHGDGSPKDPTPRDYFGVTLDTYAED